MEAKSDSEWVTYYQDVSEIIVVVISYYQVQQLGRERWYGW